MPGFYVSERGSGMQTRIRITAGENIELHCFVPDLDKHEAFKLQ